MTATKTLALTDQFKTALELVARVNALKVIKTKAEYDAANADYRTLIENEKELKKQYDENYFVVEARKVQDQNSKLKAEFDAAKKYIKGGPMKAYDDEEKRILQVKQEALAEKARVEAAKETARLVAEQKVAFDAAEKVRKEQEAIAKKSKDAAVKAAALEAARQAEARAAQAREEAAAIKADAAAAPAPTVILAATHKGVSRRAVWKWRLKDIHGREFVKGTMKDSERLKATDFRPGVIPEDCWMVDHTALSSRVERLGKEAAIPGVLEVPDPEMV